MHLVVGQHQVPPPVRRCVGPAGVQEIAARAQTSTMQCNDIYIIYAKIEESKDKDDKVVVAPVEEEAVPGAGVGGDWLPQQPRDGRQPRGLHRGEVPRPRVAQPAQLVRAGDQLQAPVLPGQWSQSHFQDFEFIDIV